MKEEREERGARLRSGGVFPGPMSPRGARAQNAETKRVLGLTDTVTRQQNP